MREHAWSNRLSDNEHEQQFKNLLDLHAITRSWLKGLNLEQESMPYQLKRVLTPGIQETLRLLQAVTEQKVPQQLGSVLDDDYPDEMIAKLSRTVWVVQAWLLQSLIERTQKSEHRALINLLEHSSWKCGKECAQERWEQIPGFARNHMQGIVAAFSDSPLASQPSRRGFLLKRAVQNSATLELLYCPHRNETQELKKVADILCRIHYQWIRGFVYGINHTAIVEYFPSAVTDTAYCRLEWYFHSPSSGSA